MVEKLTTCVCCKTNPISPKRKCYCENCILYLNKIIGAMVDAVHDVEVEAIKELKEAIKNRTKYPETKYRIPKVAAHGKL